MKRFLVLLLALGVWASTDLSFAARFAEDKKEDKKKDDKKDDKKKDDKKDDKKEEKKLTKEEQDELAKLSGNFTLTMFERDGKKSPPEELRKMKVVQKGAEWSFHMGDDITQGRDTVFPAKNPREINSLYLNGPAREKTVLGIYKIEGDTVTYCWAEPGKERPKEFATKTDSGQTLMVLKRVKEEKLPFEDDKKDKKDDKKDKKDDKKDKKDD